TTGSGPRRDAADRDAERDQRRRTKRRGAILRSTEQGPEARCDGQQPDGPAHPFGRDPRQGQRAERGTAEGADVEREAAACLRLASGERRDTGEREREAGGGHG